THLDASGRGGFFDLDDAAAGTAPPASPGPRTANPEPGTRVDRYVIFTHLGSTRHSEIYAAHDPELDRKVALKLLSLDAADEQEGYRRLMAEAQATARLAHPNVVKVHDVGTWRGRPYIAREFIEGASVHTWKRRASPSRAEVLRVMRLAGRGLGALHAAGLVHRDLNLHAILVGDDGTVRVTDMDYVGSVAGQALPSENDSGSLDSLASGELSEETTGSFVRAAGLSGIFDDSPYASPEQLLGQTADARSDQFSFCVALYEALYDSMPFGRGTVVRRLARVERGRVRLPKGRYSRRTLNAIKRGLSAQPEQRFHDMAALLKAVAPRRRRYALLAPLFVGVATVAAIAASGDEEHGTYCASVTHKLDGVWDSARRDDIRAAFEATGLAYAEDLLQFTHNHLDTWVSEWTTRHDELCREQTQGADMAVIAREMHCLSLRRNELSSVVDMLAAGDQRSIENAVRIVRDLSSVESCKNPDQWLASRDQLVEAEALNRGQAELSMLLASHRSKEALPLADVLVDQARALGHGPSLVRALAARATALSLDRSPEAEAAMHEALSEALAQGQYPDVAAIATALANDLIRRRKFTEARHWLEHGEGALTHGSKPAMPGYAGIESSRGRIASLKGEYENALSRYERARELRIASLGPDDDRVAMYRVNVGQAFQDLGRYSEARVEFEAAVEGISNALGPEHPDVGRAHMALGVVMAAQGEYEAALVHGERAQRILKQAYGESRTIVADAIVATSVAHSRMGHAAVSMALQADAIRIYRVTTGDRSYRVALALNNIGVEYFNSGNYAEAEGYYRQALERVSEQLGKDHVETARIQNTLAGALLAQGEYEEAKVFLDAVEATIEAKVPTDIPMVAYWLSYACELDAIRASTRPRSTSYWPRQRSTGHQVARQWRSAKFV
ncbi:MAG: tetratricopeptide repeat protein, partial [Nannocystaceae bacterium]|nr:tetratricopeptide repeat protein [Nannocystaceae bacterium]